MPSPLRVLLVDDNPDDRALVARELEAEYGDVEIEEVIDAAGLDVALERTYDLVITDYQLNWSDGLAVLRKVRDRDASVPTVMFTGTGTEEVAVEAMKEGLDDYVVKAPQHFKRLASCTRRAIEHAARQREHMRLLSILEATPDLVGTSDAEGRVLYLNASGREMLGIPHDEDVRRLPIADFHPAWAAELIATEGLPKAAAEGTWRGESALLTRDGREIPVSQVVIAHAAHTGSVDYFSTVARDMSRERSLQAQLQRAQKMEAVGRLAGGIAHDFNNLLTVILGEAEHAREAASDPEVRQSLLEIRRAAARATKVTGQLLQFSRGRPSEPTVFDLDELVRSMEAMIGRMIREDVRFVVRTTDGPGRVRADRGQIEQVLLNLVANARDAMPEGGLLAIETANVTLSGDDAQVRGAVEPGRYAMLAVSDSGTGMGPEVKERLFEPFFSTKEAGKGTGIGLATSYGMVRRHGGHIGVYSEVGQGTIMKVYLPQVDAPAEVSSSPEVDPWKEFSGTGSILIVEDDDALRGVTARMLEALGYRAQVAATSEEALSLLADPEQDVDLLLTDVVLRETDGPRLAWAARKIRPDLRVLFMSGYTEEVVAHRSGGQVPPLLRKPFAVADLGAKVRAALGNEAA
ncbi:MAG TPA: response regulator [Longimicrobiales bacterium]|nr:response regulator [Longimicrobiales bacterium]